MSTTIDECHAMKQLCNRSLFCEASNGRRTVPGGKSMKLGKIVINFIDGLTRVGAISLRGWSPRDPPKQWLETKMIWFSAAVR